MGTVTLDQTIFSTVWITKISAGECNIICNKRYTVSKCNGICNKRYTVSFKTGAKCFFVFFLFVILFLTKWMKLFLLFINVTAPSTEFQWSLLPVHQNNIPSLVVSTLTLSCHHLLAYYVACNHTLGFLLFP